VASFNSPGLSASVADDSTTTFRATATDSAGNASACSAGSIVYVEDSTAPSAPLMAESDPDPPANDNAPRIKGTAEAGSTVELYDNPICAGTPVAQGSAASFASPGIQVSVPDNSTRDFRAAAVDAPGNRSACSSAPVQYVEDSAAPSPPALTGTAPASPANDNSPRVQGQAEPGSTVRLHAGDGCAGAPVAQGSAADLGGAGLQVTVADDSSTAFSATATDAAGNQSACSGAITYVETSTAPGPPAPGPPGPGPPVPGPGLPGPAPQAPGAQGSELDDDPVIRVTARSLGTVRSDRRGNLTFRRARAGCGPDAGSCDVVATASTARKVTVKAAGRRRRKVKLGRGAFTLDEGKSAAVKIRLSRTGMKVVKRLKSVNATVKIVVENAAGESITREVAVKIKAPKRPRKRR
jgi:hypothetical protein